MPEIRNVEWKRSRRDESCDDVALPGVKLSELDGRVFDGFRRLGV